MKARLIHNPTAGPRDVQRGLKRVRSFLKRQGWSVEYQLTEKPGDTTRLSRAAAQEGYDVVIVAGGDGTINEAVNGLVALGQHWVSCRSAQVTCGPSNWAFLRTR